MKKNLLKSNKKNNNIIMIQIKSIPEVDLNQKITKFNGFNIIELNEDDDNNNIDKDYFSKDLENEFENLSEKEISRLKNIANKCENYYYMNQQGDTIINEPCFKCRGNFFNSKDLLYFVNRKDLLSYLKYAFYFLKKIIFINHQNYSNNKYDLEKCDSNYLINWKFFIPKTMCRICFMEVINMENFIGNLKNIFCDIDKIDLIKIKNKGFSSRFRRSNYHHKIKRKFFSSKIKNNSLNNESIKKSSKNKINENVSINNEKNYIIINKICLNDIIDLSLIKKKDESKIEVIPTNNNENNVVNNINNISNNFNMYNIINNYQINQPQIPNIFTMQNENIEKHIPKFICNKIILYIYIFTKSIINEIQKINNCLKSFSEVYKGHISLEYFNKVKSYFYQRYLNIRKNQKTAYNLFLMIHDNIHKKICNYINQLLEKEIKIEVKTQLIDFLKQLDIINKERYKLIEQYIDSTNQFNHFYFFLNQQLKEKELLISCLK